MRIICHVIILSYYCVDEKEVNAKEQARGVWQAWRAAKSASTASIQTSLCHFNNDVRQAALILLHDPE